MPYALSSQHLDVMMVGHPWFDLPYIKPLIFEFSFLHSKQRYLVK